MDNHKIARLAIVAFSVYLDRAMPLAAIIQLHVFMAMPRKLLILCDIHGKRKVAVLLKHFHLLFHFMASLLKNSSVSPKNE